MAEILPFVQRASAFVPPGQVLNIAEVLEHGTAFVACKGGVPFLGYTLEPNGREMVLTTAAGKSDIDLIHALSILLAAHGKEFDSIRFHTIRRGLVRRAMKYGYEVAAVVGGVHIMRKQNGKQ